MSASSRRFCLVCPPACPYKIRHAVFRRARQFHRARRKNSIHPTRRGFCSANAAGTRQPRRRAFFLIFLSCSKATLCPLRASLRCRAPLRAPIRRRENVLCRAECLSYRTGVLQSFRVRCAAMLFLPGKAAKEPFRRWRRVLF